MPVAAKRRTKKKPDPLAELVEETAASRRPSLEALKQEGPRALIEGVLAHNDQALDRGARISRERVLEKLEEHWGIVVGKETLQKFAIQEFGRRSWARR